MIPDIDDIVATLKSLQKLCQPCSCGTPEFHDSNCETLLAVRLEVTPSDWIVNYGDPGFDQDHRGHWGTSTLAADDDEEILDMAAQQMLDEVEESLAMEEEWAY